MLTYTERVKRCAQFFWMHDRFTVVVKCKECGRHQNAWTSAVMSLYGKLRLAHCGSCDKFTCAPVLKDHKTIAEVL